MIGNCIYIKRAELFHDQAYITKALAPYGTVSAVEFLPKSNERGQKYNGAIVTFSAWNAHSPNTQCLFDNLAVSNDVYVYHNNQHHWVVMEYKKKPKAAMLAPPDADADAAGVGEGGGGEEGAGAARRDPPPILFGNEMDDLMMECVQLESSDKVKKWLCTLVMRMSAMQDQIHILESAEIRASMQTTRARILCSELDARRVEVDCEMGRANDAYMQNLSMWQEIEMLRDWNSRLQIRIAELEEAWRDERNMCAYWEQMARPQPLPQQASVPCYDDDAEETCYDDDAAETDEATTSAGEMYCVHADEDTGHGHDHGHGHEAGHCCSGDEAQDEEDETAIDVPTSAAFWNCGGVGVGRGSMPLPQHPEFMYYYYPPIVPSPSHHVSTDVPPYPPMPVKIFVPVLPPPPVYFPTDTTTAADEEAAEAAPKPGDIV